MSRLISNRRTVAEKRGGAGGITITPHATSAALVAAVGPDTPAGYHSVGAIVYYWSGTAWGQYPMPEPTLDLILEAVGILVVDVYATQITIAADAAFDPIAPTHTDMDAGTAWGSA